MAYLLHIFDLGIKFLVPAMVWTLLVIGLFQLVRESIPRPRIASRRVAREGGSR
ncbi:MAG: hypothetical protein PVG71_13190 [Anaerolineae bacterium]|jgi:hypothetical protein